MISIGFPNGCEQLDSQFLDTILKANHEDILRDALASYTLTLTSGKMFMNRVHISYYTNDGCIYRSDEGGARLIGINESKFTKNWSTISGWKLNAQFAQVVVYSLILGKSKNPTIGNISQIRFFWLTSNTKFHLVLVKENKELLNALCDWYYDLGNVTPCKVYEFPGISEIFDKYPLNIHRSFDIGIKILNYRNLLNVLLIV